jgi:hypothetical protein
MVLMPRAMWSGLAEPMNAALATGSVKFGLKSFAYQFQNLWNKTSAQERTELAQYLGTVTSSMHDSIMLSRMSADYSDSPRLNRLMTQYYKTTGMTQMVNAQRVAATTAGSGFLGKLARDYLNTGTGRGELNAKDDATRWFNELGVPDRIHDDFAKWMTALGGALPKTSSLVNDSMGSAYGLAIRRLVDRVNQDPYKVDRAVASSRPIVGLMFQLMSFNYQFARNILMPLYGQIEHSAGRAKLAAGGGLRGNLAGATAAGGSLVHAGAMVGAVLGAGLMTTTLRQLLFAPDQMKDHADKGDLFEYLRDLTFQRSGLNGTLDPIIQVFSNLRYDADIASLMDGATVHWFSKNIQDVIQPFVTTNDSPNSNTRLYNQARGMFNLVGVPLAAVGLTMLGEAGGPLTRLASGAALQYGTSPAAAAYAASTVAGPKGTTLPKEGESTLPDLSSLLPELPSLDGGDAAPADSAGMNAPWGLVDDVAVPTWKYGQVAFQRLPGPVKVAAGLGALGYAGYDYLSKTAPYREAAANAAGQ